MLRLEDSIAIRCSRSDVYALISDVERHTSLLPGYMKSRIVKRDAGTAVVEREAIIYGRKRHWTSLVRWEPDQALRFEQLEGPLKGMQIVWQLKSEGKNTHLSIVHEVDVRPRWKGWWMERFVAKPAIEKTARIVLEAIKVAAEAQKNLS